MAKKLPKWAIKQAGGINKKAWRLAKRGRRTSTTRKKRSGKPMARRKTYRRYSRRASSMNPLIKGIIAGAGATMIKKYLNVPFADDLAVLGVGYFMKDNTLKTIGAVGLGSDLAGTFTGNGTNGGGQYIG